MSSDRKPETHLDAAWTYLPEYASEALPRYTSYPPANRFHAGVGPKQAKGAIRALPSGATISLYLHIPYCQQLCWYCGCHTSVPTRADPVETYLDALHQEIMLVGADVPAGVRVTHVHVGGGSPDTLRPSQLRRLFARLNETFTFDRSAEIAVELDPRGVSDEFAWAMKESGVTRTSLGVQVLDESVQKHINRMQSRDQIVEAILRLRQAGIGSLNVDVMYGLPGQSLAHVVETAEFAADQAADRVAVFGYAHVPWFKKHQGAIKIDELPQGEARFRQAEAAAATLRARSYRPIGFDHFALPGDNLALVDKAGGLRRNFQGYTVDQSDALIGFGSSAISSMPGLYYQNEADSRAYRTKVGAEEMPVVRGAVVSADDRIRSRLIETLLCRFGAAVEPGLLIPALPRLRRLEAAGLIEIIAGRIEVTLAGRPYVRNVAASFDAQFDAVPGRHSLAV
jgi:oxygen-independent coproporphyrinogen-3 oxidase